MNDERLFILRMLEEGKVTAQEAVELLEALDVPNQEKPDKHDQGWNTLSKYGEEFAHKVENAADRFSKAIESKIEPGLSEKLSSLPKMLAKIPFVTGFSDETHKFVQEYTGKFSPELVDIVIDIQTLNGEIKAEGWDQEHYKLVVTQRIKAKERDLALEKVITLNIPEDDTAASKIELPIVESRDVSISYELFIPRKGPYVISQKCVNGRCSISNLVARRMKLVTANGSINVKQSKADDLSAASSNGAINFDYVEAEHADLRTSNGSLKFIGSAGNVTCKSTNGSIKVTPLTFAYEQSNLQLNTINGPIRCTLPRLPELTAKIEASASTGRVSIDIPGFVFQIQERHAGRHRVLGEVKTATEQSKSLNIEAQVVTGSITVTQQEEQSTSN